MPSAVIGWLHCNISHVSSTWGEYVQTWGRRNLNNKIICNANQHEQNQISTITGHFIRYTLLVPGWTHFCLQNCLNSLWHIFNKVLETFLRDFGPYWDDSIMQLLHLSAARPCESPVPPHPKVLLDWDLVTVEAIWVKWTHFHVQ